MFQSQIEELHVITKPQKGLVSLNVLLMSHRNNIVKLERSKKWIATFYVYQQQSNQTANQDKRNE